jgi:DNA-binding transcriptional MerR regulator
MTVYNAGMDERWTIEQLAPLVEMALDLSGYNGQHSGRVRNLPDLRTIRYYTTLGLLDSPAEMRGRKAFYGRRHLVQLVAIKRLQSGGLSLTEVQKSLAGIDDRALMELASLPSDFWQRALGAAEQALDASSPAQAPRAVGRHDKARHETARRGAFWAAEPGMATKTTEDHPLTPRPALHLPVIEGVELVLEGIDPADWTPEAIARLKGPLAVLAEALRELKLTQGK